MISFAPLRLLSVRFAVAAFALSLGACAIPHDTRGALERIEGEDLRVGVPGELALAGEERQWLEELAMSLDASLTLQSGEAHDLVKSLRAGEIDLIARLPAKTPFKKEVGLSQPYPAKSAKKNQYVWAVRPGANDWLYEIDRVIFAHDGQ